MDSLFLFKDHPVIFSPRASHSLGAPHISHYLLYLSTAVYIQDFPNKTVPTALREEFKQASSVFSILLHKLLQLFLPVCFLHQIQVSGKCERDGGGKSVRKSRQSTQKRALFYVSDMARHCTVLWCLPLCSESSSPFSGQMCVNGWRMAFSLSLVNINDLA